MIKGKGLKPTKKSGKDYSFHKTFGVVSPILFPNEYILMSTILDQTVFNECTAYSSSASIESETGISVSPDYYYAKEGEEAGSLSLEGYDMRIAISVRPDFGALALTKAPYTAQQNGIQFVADPNNWNPALDSIASSLKCEGYFRIHSGSGLDLFDQIRSAMLLQKNQKRTPIVGGMWYDEWDTQDGMIPTQYGREQGLHARKIAGWTTINGIPYIVEQNSWGTIAGRNGFYYFPREVVNKEYIDVFIWSDIPNPIDISRIGQIQNIINFIIKVVQNILKQIGIKK